MMKKLQGENDEIFKKDVDLAFSSLLYWFWDNFFQGKVEEKFKKSKKILENS